MSRLLVVFCLITLARSLQGGESALTTTYQPLDGLGSGAIVIAPVACHDWYASSGQATAIQLISAPNVPPTNNPKEAKEDLNLASQCGLVFYSSDLGDPEAPLELTLDATRFSVPVRFGHPQEDILRASLECLRRCLPPNLRKTPLTLKADGKQKEWMSAIVRQFNAHKREKVFYVPEE